MLSKHWARHGSTCLYSQHWEVRAEDQKMGGHTKTLSQKKRKHTRISYNWTAVAEQWQACKGAKVRGLKELFPTQLVAVSGKTSHKGPSGGRRGKGAVTASRGSNTFHCPLGQQVKGEASIQS